MNILNMKLHRKMWNWIAEHPKSTKLDFYNKLTRKERQELETNCCIGCTHAKKVSINIEGIKASFCKYCPFDGLDCIKPNSLYGEYVNNRDNGNYELASKYARDIANIRLRSSI